MSEIKKEHFINRELSWMDFNQRVLVEAKRQDLPLLERLKFLAIVSSNFDEFFMVRVASLRRQAESGIGPVCPTGMTAQMQMRQIRKRYLQCTAEMYDLLNHELIPLLKDNGLVFLQPAAHTPSQEDFVRQFFQKELFDVLSPIRVEENRPFPYTGNLKLHLAFLLKNAKDPAEEPRMMILELPSHLGRFVWLPGLDDQRAFSLLEDIVADHIERITPGYQVMEYLSFRLTRDADVPVDEEGEEDFVEAMEKILQRRMHSSPVRLEIGTSSDELINRLCLALDIDEEAVYPMHGPLNLKDLFSLAGTSAYPELQFPPAKRYRTLQGAEDLFEAIKKSDLLLHHPYESFSPVVRLIRAAADDPQVLAIKMTLYRTSGDSPIIQALALAAREGKQVTVLVEVKARFDEEQNLNWAETLERSGCIVIYGLANLKVHAKALLIIRREDKGVRRYVHLGTGNYHDKTARLYTDMGLFSAREEFTQEVSLFFNAITGYSAITPFRYLTMAPTQLRKRLLDLIQKSIDQKNAGMETSIIVKMNSLADEKMIRALYEASQAGVKVRLNIRGICMLVPGVPGVSENIEVVSVVGRFLEHSRIFIFKAGEHEDVFLSSADWMVRNLNKRVELFFPVLHKGLKKRISGIMDLYFQDNLQAHDLKSSGEWIRKTPQDNQKSFSIQDHLLSDAMKQQKHEEKTQQGEFRIRKRD